MGAKLFKVLCIIMALRLCRLWSRERERLACREQHKNRQIGTDRKTDRHRELKQTETGRQTDRRTVTHTFEELPAVTSVRPYADFWHREWRQLWPCKAQMEQEQVWAEGRRQWPLRVCNVMELTFIIPVIFAHDEFHFFTSSARFQPSSTMDFINWYLTFLGLALRLTHNSLLCSAFFKHF